MVISTFLSAPIMYVSAWLLTIPLMDPTPLVAELENVSFNISIVSLIGLVRGFCASISSALSAIDRDVIAVEKLSLRSCSLQVWTIAVMLLSRKFSQLPHVFALNLFLAQVS